MLDVGELRRDKGTGSAPRWRADGRWEARYTRPDGKRVSVFDPTPGPAGKRAVAKRRDEAIAAANAGVDPSLVPLGVYLARYLARRSNLTPASRTRYDRLVKHVNACEARDERGKLIRDKPIVRLRPDDIEDLYLERHAAGMAPKGIELLHTLINGALAQAAARGKVLRNPAEGVSRPKVKRTPPDVYDDAQLRRLLDVAEGHPLGGLVALLATTSLRHGELLDLRWRDLDLKRGALTVIDPEKGGRPRTIPLTTRAVRMLGVHRARQNEQRLARGGAWEDRDLVFPSRWGDRGDESWNREQLRALTDANDLPRVTPRNLRHAVLTSLVRNGIHMKVAQELAGHGSMQQTQDTYSHVDQGMLDVARKAMAKVVGE